MAVTRDGIPVRVWSWPGSSADSDLIRQVRATSASGRSPGRLGRRPRLHLAEPARPDAGRRRVHHRREAASGSAEVKAALSRQGRYATVQTTCRSRSQHRHRRPLRALLQPRPGRTRRHHPRSSSRSSKKSSPTATSFPRPIVPIGAPCPQARLKRFLRTTPGGLLRIDKQKIKTEAHLDGKYLLRCSDPSLPAEDIALGYSSCWSRARLARHEADPRPAPGLPPARGPHPRPRPALLARPAADPRRRDHRRRPLYLAADPHRTPATACSHLQRPGRDLPPDHRASQVPARCPDRPRA